MSHEMYAKVWSFNAPKTSDAVLMLDLIATLQSRSRNTNNVKANIHMDNKKTRRRVNTTTRVANHFNQDLAAEINDIQKMKRKADL